MPVNAYPKRVERFMGRSSYRMKMSYLGGWVFRCKVNRCCTAKEMWF